MALVIVLAIVIVPDVALALTLTLTLTLVMFIFMYKPQLTRRPGQRGKGRREGGRPKTRIRLLVTLSVSVEGVYLRWNTGYEGIGYEVRGIGYRGSGADEWMVWEYEWGRIGV